jgi:hypothetical protein
VLGPRLPIVGTQALLPISQLFENAGNAAGGVLMVVGNLPLDRLNATGRRFVHAFGATQPGGRVTPVDVYTATATEVLIDAIARSHGPRESIARALATTHLCDGPLGRSRSAHLASR